MYARHFQVSELRLSRGPEQIRFSRLSSSSGQWLVLASKGEIGEKVRVPGAQMYDGESGRVAEEGQNIRSLQFAKFSGIWEQIYCQ